jgi:carbon-monoxide dehydrogenase small subunit
MDAPAPAVVNAIADATGVRVSAIPVLPERLLRALRAEATREEACADPGDHGGAELHGERRAAPVSVPPMKRLLDVLREDLELPGARKDAARASAARARVLLDGEPVNSCLVAAGQVDGAQILTVEGLARGEKLSALQQAFVEMGGAQCGICTPGMLVTPTRCCARRAGACPGRRGARGAGRQSLPLHRLPEDRGRGARAAGGRQRAPRARADAPPKRG